MTRRRLLFVLGAAALLCVGYWSGRLTAPRIAVIQVAVPCAPYPHDCRLERDCFDL